MIAVDLQESATETLRVQYEQTDQCWPRTTSPSCSPVSCRSTAASRRWSTTPESGFRRPFADISFEEWDQVIGVNLRGCFAARRPARANASGRGRPDRQHRIPSRYHNYSWPGRSLPRLESGDCAPDHGARVRARVAEDSVNYVAPSATPPDPPLVPTTLVAQIPHGWIVVPDDITGVGAFLASPEGRVHHRTDAGRQRRCRRILLIHRQRLGPSLAFGNSRVLFLNSDDRPHIDRWPAAGQARAPNTRTDPQSGCRLHRTTGTTRSEADRRCDRGRVQATRLLSVFQRPGRGDSRALRRDWSPNPSFPVPRERLE
jgi:hypothetical protein